MSRRPNTESSPASIAILGADAVLAALPATSVQLTHACRALGYDMVFPASWGDELVAQGALQYLTAHPGRPAVFCACPRVVDRLTRVGTELEPWMLVLAAPPVAAARYLRAAFGERRVHITYVGECPGAVDPSIDARLDPALLLAQFAEQAIVPAEQPELFESILPPDRRRHLSLPGGLPSAEHIAADDPRRALVELDGEEFLVDLAQRLISCQNALIDLAVPAGCACAGATRGARATLIALEPPRAHGPILDSSINVNLDIRQSTHNGTAADPLGTTPGDAAPAAVPAPLPRRKSPLPPVVRQHHGAAVPRAFTAHRALAARRVAPEPDPVPFPTRPRTQPSTGPAAARLTPYARAGALPLTIEPAHVVPPPPAKLRPNPTAGGRAVPLTSG